MNHRTRIKICGVTRPQDALFAAKCGADAIGMILHADSRRKIDLDVARQIIGALPAFVTPVGVFVDADPDFVAQTATKLGLRYVQLHGRETPIQIAALGDFSVIKAIRPADVAEWESAIKAAEILNLKAVLIETGARGQTGGTGIENDWAALAEVRQTSRLFDRHSFVAAGGLNAGNVASVIKSIQPWAVDVSTGVEESIGIKSEAKIADFCAAVRSADSKMSA